MLNTKCFPGFDLFVSPSLVNSVYHGFNFYYFVFRMFIVFQNWLNILVHIGFELYYFLDLHGSWYDGY